MISTASLHELCGRSSSVATNFDRSLFGSVSCRQSWLPTTLNASQLDLSITQLRLEFPVAFHFRIGVLSPNGRPSFSIGLAVFPNRRI